MIAVPMNVGVLCFVRTAESAREKLIEGFLESRYELRRLFPL
jgi:hypothetical protein